MSELDPPARHAVAQLSMAERVLPALLATLDANTAYLDLLVTAAGAEPAAYHALSLAERLDSTVQADGRKALLKAAKCTVKARDAMSAGSPERAAVLLRGAAALGIATTWNPVLPGEVSLD
jgi:hypothetical protein